MHMLPALLPVRLSTTGCGCGPTCRCGETCRCGNQAPCHSGCACAG